jgi:hypothetical protein
MGDVGPVHPREAYMAMITILNDLLDATADIDDDTDEEQALAEARSLHMKAIEALCLLERDFPLTELSIFVHEILHVPEFIYRWNAVRNYGTLRGLDEEVHQKPPLERGEHGLCTHTVCQRSNIR